MTDLYRPRPVFAVCECVAFSVQLATLLRRPEAAQAGVAPDRGRAGCVRALAHVVQLHGDAVGRHREEREPRAVLVPREGAGVVLCSEVVEPRQDLAEGPPRVHRRHAEMEVVPLVPPAHVRGVRRGVLRVHQLLELVDVQRAARVASRPLHEVQLQVVGRDAHVRKGEDQRRHAAAAANHTAHVPPKGLRVEARVARAIRGELRDARRPGDGEAAGVGGVERREDVVWRLACFEEEARQRRDVPSLGRQQRLPRRHELEQDVRGGRLHQQAVVPPVVGAVGPLKRQRARAALGEEQDVRVEVGHPEARVEVEQRVVAARLGGRLELLRHAALDSRDPDRPDGARRRPLTVRRAAVVRDGVQPEAPQGQRRRAVLAAGASHLDAARLAARAVDLVVLASGKRRALEAARVMRRVQVRQHPVERACRVGDQVRRLANPGAVHLRGRRAGEEEEHRQHIHKRTRPPRTSCVR
eukprot:CAMPEP_0185367516 /NCGR_PEP_ID=MMETSP1364-20130426/14414_1 /TAXON_ID=38817 /ORGANISM="Gephyrocapsa oceanica, Strain RCC1303" /LENGTH=469 /DNA_ID=CAMNT_0027968159 /DNA_START=36 /DNA_END=1441 /DNA_ORIENTATION=+